MNTTDLTKDPRALASIVNAFARAGVWDEALFRHMSRVARMTEPKALSVNDCAALVGAFSKAQTRAGARLRDGALFRRLSLTVQAKEPSAFTPRAVSNILSSFARAGVWDRVLFKRITRIALNLTDGEERIPFRGFKAQELASMAWAVAKAFGSNHKEVAWVCMSGGHNITQSFFSVVADEVRRRGWSEFKNREAATLLWALGPSPPPKKEKDMEYLDLTAHEKAQSEHH
eukprot:CAMPEP_0114114206 /NCGR_PEP_ID=MMETSP0043_2-20121206/3315_1 /TAXON_ID=464988 /ORGANISM="Hemiselmis andersenii, Strain CCMP644" /LENGTH=229 /DNA_ID=CAMNT_0001206393 /DNA_START=101 /DNA_END=791 /DNA_ORIENTATION=+